MSCNVFSEQLPRQCLSRVLWHRSNRGGEGSVVMEAWDRENHPAVVFIFSLLSLSNVAVIRGLQDLSSPSQGLSPAVEASSPNHWTTTGVPAPLFLQYFLTSVKSRLACNGWESNPTLVTLWLPCRNGSPSSGLCGPAFMEHYYLGPVLFLLQWSFLL